MLAVLAVLVLAAAVGDLHARRIPNVLTGAGWIAGVAIQAYERGWAGMQDALLGSLAAIAVYGLLFALRAMGGGDVKLMTAIGAFTGPTQWFVIFILAAILGGALALLSILTKGQLTSVVRNIGTILWELAHLRAPHKANPTLDISDARARTLPHGVAIALATLLWIYAKR